MVSSPYEKIILLPKGGGSRTSLHIVEVRHLSISYFILLEDVEICYTEKRKIFSARGVYIC